MKYLVFDISNVLYRTYFANKAHDVDTSTGLAHHTALMSMNKFYRQFKPHKVVMAFDRSSWRKQYTASDECISGKKYKGNRRQKMTPKEKEKFMRFLEHVNEFEDIMREHTSVVCLGADGLEADDFIAGFCEAYGWDSEDEIIIVSRDRDLAQLLGDGKDKFYSNITQYDPFTGKEVTVKTAIYDCLKEKKEGAIPEDLISVDFFLYAKAMRGDTGDNVQSAYPGIRKNKIYESYRDPYTKANLFHHTWKDETGKEMVVKKLFEEGQFLMNLRKQPEEIRMKMFETILEEMEDPGKFDYFRFLQFLGKYEMKEISKSLENFIPLLSR